MLKIKNLFVKVNNKTILNKFNLDIKKGEIHAIMGPNGTGKSTICKTIIGDPNYKITKGEILFNEKCINNLDADEIARAGIYLVNQSPLEIEGVSNAEMLRAAIYAKTKENVLIFEFNKKLIELCNDLNIPREFIHRDINVGNSGGEKKKIELLHMWMLEPKFIILDELDSGLDIDSLKLVVNSLNKYYQKFKPAILIITHNLKLLNMIKTDYIHILNDGSIIETGDINLALEIEKNGFLNKKRAITVSGQDRQ